MELASKYNPADVEGKWYQYWLDHHLFSSKPDGREPYTIVIPPPNVTGVLHMGHMLNNTIQDILVRRARMEGKNACWVPGTDHASIATEAKVVNKLAAQGIKKTDLTRDEFLKHAWDWTDEHGGIILKQLRKLGASCDWDRTAFTMDEKRSESVLKVFVDLFNKGLIYRGVRMVNWDPKALTALSDEEVIYKEEHGKLYYLRYKVEGDPEGRYAVVATTRPETIMGDTAMCINPNDPKNEWLKGKKVIVPLVNRAIPVIEDDYVDIEFGTGCLKVTPAHDVNDYMLGEKYNLPSIDIFNDNGTLSEAAGMYIGMDRFDVRIQIEKDLEAAGLLDKTEAYTNKVGYSERTNVVIEPKLSMQWFLKMQHFADMALPPVMNDELKFYPAKYKNTYRHWMENIKDWCISRQLWWGHRIPAYFLPEGGYVVAATAEVSILSSKQCFLRFLHSTKVESINHLLHQCGDFCITEVADTTFMSMVYFFSMREFTCFNIQTNLLICITERHTFTCQTIYLFHAKNKEVFVIIKNMFIYLYFIHDIGCHLQTVFQFLKSRKENFFDNLQITEIARRQIIRNHHDLLGKRLQFITFSTCQFKDIGILLMRHNAGPRGTVIRQLNETEVLTVKHTGVKS